MSDFEDSDDERYANEPFEIETDNEVTEIDSDASNKSDENSHNNDDNEVEEGEEEHDDDVNDDDDDDDDDLSSVKLNTVSFVKKAKIIQHSSLNFNTHFY